MTLGKRLEEGPQYGDEPAVVGTSCRLMQVRAQLPSDEERAALDVMIADHKKWSRHDIWIALKSEGITVGEIAISYHRSGRCTCVIG